MIQVTERRAAQRAPLGTRVSWQVEGETQWHEDESRDVSSAGIMLKTRAAIRPGTVLTLKFNLPNLKFQDPIVADAEVMRVVERHGRQSGLGLRFVTLKSRNYQVVHDFVCRILGLPLDDGMEGLGNKVGSDYTFSMERLIRESEDRKAARQEEKLAAAEAMRCRNARRAWICRTVKILLLGIGLFCSYKLLVLLGELASKITLPK